MMKAASLCLVDVEAERAGLHRVLAAGLQDQADRRARQREQDGAAHRHEPERDLVIHRVADRDHVGHRETDLAAGQTSGDHDEILQHQHGDQRRQSEIGPAHAQRRQRQHHAAGDGGERAGDDAEPDRRLIEIVEDAGRIAAGADQKCRPEVHLAGEAEQQVPSHGEHAEIIGDGEQTENVAGDAKRQKRGEHDDAESDQQYAGSGDRTHLRRPNSPRGRTYITATSSSSAGMVR